MKKVNNEVLFRIFHKDAESITIESADFTMFKRGPEKIKIPWDEFNKHFQIQDDLWFHVKTEKFDVEKEKIAFVLKAMPFLMMVDPVNPKISDLLMISCKADEFCKKFPGSTLEEFVDYARIWKENITEELKELEK